MAGESDTVSGPEIEQIKIVLNSIYLCLKFAMQHITAQEGEASAAAFKDKMLEALKSGDIDMALLEESTTYDFVVSKIQALD